MRKERVDILWNSCALGECVSDEERNVDITSIRSDPEIEIPGYSQILDSHSRGEKGGDWTMFVHHQLHTIVLKYPA